MLRRKKSKGGEKIISAKSHEILTFKNTKASPAHYTTIHDFDFIGYIIIIKNEKTEDFKNAPHPTTITIFVRKKNERKLLQERKNNM